MAAKPHPGRSYRLTARLRHVAGTRRGQRKYPDMDKLREQAKEVAMATG